MKSISRTQVSELLGYRTFFLNCFTLFQIGIPMPITRSQRSKIIGYEKDLGLLRLSAIIRCSEERPASLVWAPLPTQEPLVNTNLLTFIDFEKWTLNVDLAHSFQGQFCSKIFWQDKLGKLCRPVYLDPKGRRRTNVFPGSLEFRYSCFNLSTTTLIFRDIAC